MCNTSSRDSQADGHKKGKCTAIPAMIIPVPACCMTHHSGLKQLRLDAAGAAFGLWQPKTGK
jgi:hypothetical protein